MAALVLLVVAGAVGACSDDPGIEDLATVTLDRAPPGFIPIEEGFGAFDLDGYVERFSTSKEKDREELEEVGLGRGFARGWVSGQGTALVVFVFEVRGGGEADHLLEYFVDDATTARRAQKWDVEGIDGAEGLTYAETSAEGSQGVHSVLFTRGRRLYLTASQHAEPNAGRETILAFARAQDQGAR